MLYTCLWHTWQIGGDGRNTHHCTLSRCVAPWFIVTGENTKMTASNKFLIVQPKQRVCRWQEFRVKYNLGRKKITLDWNKQISSGNTKCLQLKLQNIHHCTRSKQEDIIKYQYPLVLYYLMYGGVCYNERMLQQTVFVNKIRMLQRTRRNTIGWRSTHMRMMCQAFPLWLERQSSLLSFVMFIHSSKRWENALQLINVPQDSHPRWVGMMIPLLPPVCNFLLFLLGTVCSHFSLRKDCLCFSNLHVQCIKVK